MAECWGTLGLVVDVSTAWNALYYCVLPRCSYPFTFAEVPLEWVTLNNGGGNMWLALDGNTKTQTHNGCILSGASVYDYSIWLEYSVKGLWK